MKTAEKTYLKPGSVAEAISFARENRNGFRYLAGGTDVIVNKFQGNEGAECLIDISAIDELKGVSIDGKSLKIGSLVRLDALRSSDIILDKFPALLEAAQSVASPMLRKTATIGGNILCENRCVFFNQSEWWREAVGYCLKCEGDICIATGGKKNCFSKFVSDMAPVLIALNAVLEVVDDSGKQVVRLEDIYTGDGLKPRNLSQTAIITSINILLDENFLCVFKKLRPREAVDFTSLTAVVSRSNSGNIRLVLGGVDPRPVIVTGTAESNIDELIGEATKKARIVNNDFYSRKYRKEMIPVFLNECFDEIQESLKSKN